MHTTLLRAFRDRIFVSCRSWKINESLINGGMEGLLFRFDLFCGLTGLSYILIEILIKYRFNENLMVNVIGNLFVIHLPSK